MTAGIALFLRALAHLPRTSLVLQAKHAGNAWGIVQLLQNSCPRQRGLSNHGVDQSVGICSAHAVASCRPLGLGKAGDAHKIN